MIRSYKFRLYPNKEQEEKLEWTLEQCRLVYNKFLEELNKQDKPNKNEMSSMLLLWKNENEELKNVYSKTLQYEVSRLFINLKLLSKRKKNGYKVGRLCFKGKEWFKSFIYNQSGFKIINTNKRLSILKLSKIGEIPIRISNNIKGKIKQIIIKHEQSDKWFAIMQVDDEKPKPISQLINNVVGIDLGLTKFIHDSNNKTVKNPKYLKKSLEKLRKEQRKLAKKKRKGVTIIINKKL